jgi:hypothetical protein
MYINTNYLEERDITVEEMGILQVIKQNRIEDMSAFLEKIVTEDFVSVFSDLDFIEFINPKRKDDTKYMCMRTTSKSNTFLDVATTPCITVGDEKMANYLMDMYLTSIKNTAENKRTIGNKKKVIQYTAEFRQSMSLTLHEMYWLCDLFIDEVEYTLILERVFFDSNRHRYGRFLNHIEDSKLYQFFDARKEEVEAYWKIKIKE